MGKIHLICNAHLDPVWLWQWQEGAAEAISTFRVAADFCEKYDGFVFNHNEVILYQWVEEYEPALFKRIQELVKQGKWHIMGGWYLQPDCNMPSGESFVRQILLGRTYFKEKFGVEPTTAINFDPFGHTRGLAQILKKSGYDSYLFCRPLKKSHGFTNNLEAEDFVWVGYDGSEVLAHRSFNNYLSKRGKAREKVELFMQENDKLVGAVLWGIGNHGGGPSKIDLDDLTDLIQSTKDVQIIHSTPEAYFADLKKNMSALPRREKDLNPWAVGCYTTQIKIKQEHRLLENEIYMTEKMASHASLLGLMEYPREQINDALRDLALAQFHDILPGTQVYPAEEDSMRTMGHGMEIISKIKAKAFFKLAIGQEKARQDEIPVMVYNPHPFKVKNIFECEFNLADQHNADKVFLLPILYSNGKRIPCQVEKECSNMSSEWRKRIIFEAELEPTQINRFDCTFEELTKRPEPKLKAENGNFTFKNDKLKVIINGNTGLMDVYEVDGKSYLKPKAFMPLVIEDDDHSIGTFTNNYRNVIGAFQLMNTEQSTKISGVFGRTLDAVRVIEDGEVRTIIEAMFSYGDSYICIDYILPKNGTQIEIRLKVHWNEKSKMLKLSLPTTLQDARYMGQVAYGKDYLPDNGDEAVAQKWTAVVSEKDDCAFTCINDGIYGSDFADGEMRLSLLRSPRYGCLASAEGRAKLYNDRYIPRVDQGEQFYRFWINAGELEERNIKIDREALVHNEKPFALSFFPAGEGEKPKQLIVIDDEAVQVSAIKKAETSEDYIIRLFEPTGKERPVIITLPALALTYKLQMGKFEIKTLKLNMRTKTLQEVNLMENIKCKI